MDAAQLQSFAVNLLRALGATTEVAEIVAASLLDGNRQGCETHGLDMLPLYARMISAGVLDPQVQPEVNLATGAVVRIDGHDGFGQLAGALAVASGCKIAAESGVAAVAINNGGHLGRLGEWAKLAAKNEMVFLAFCNSGGGARNVAPFGSSDRMLSTNPVAFGVPSFSALPHDVIVDISTSQVAGARMKEHFLAGKPLDPQWTTTAAGKPLADASEFMRGLGALLPLGGHATGHKGYALSVIVEILGGIAGGMMAGEHDPEWFSNAALFLFVNPKKFIPADELGQRISALAEYLAGGGARLPGAGAYSEAQKSLEQGIELPEHLCSELKAIASELGVDVPASLSEVVNAKPYSDPMKTW
jgi:uncharacterized oxidoreductase